MDRPGLGHAKLLLFGEHAAVHGFPSLGLGLGESLELKYKPKPSGGWRAPELPLEATKRFGEFVAFVSQFMPAIAQGSGELRLASTIPVGLGFGSSAALCVALARAFAPEGSSSLELWSIAHRAEAFFHGTPSGIDTGLSLLGGLRAFRPLPHGLPETRELRSMPLHLAIGALPRRGSTAGLVGGLGRRLQAGEEGASRLVEELGACSARAIDLLEEGNPRAEARQELGALLARAHAALGALGLGDPGLDRLIGAGVEGGALGGKPSGAGGGGAFFLLYATARDARTGARALTGFARRQGIRLASPLRALTWKPR